MPSITSDKPARSEYRTKSAKAIRDLMQQTTGHLSAEDVYHRLHEAGMPIGLSTVYRQLERLVEEGAVRKISADRCGSCYQAVQSTNADHYHLICSVCGKLQHLSCERVLELFRHIAGEHQFSIDPGRTVLYGTCGTCRRAQNKKHF